MEKVETPNCWPDRKGESIRGIVIHCTEGTYESAKSWIVNPQSAVSYNFIVKEDGTPVEFVAPEAAAWANGLTVRPTWRGITPRVNPNLYTLSIAYAGTGAVGPTKAQALMLAGLIAEYAQKFSIPIDALHIIGHNEIRQDKSCPGKKCNMIALRWLASLQA